ncbi:MAG: carbohydrate kinase family protein [Candidatus Hadarchaeota archaeon]
MCVGLATWDLIFLLPEPPTFEGSPSVTDFNQEGGGPAATGAVAASRLGASSAFASRTGDDAFGDMIVEDLKTYGVEPILHRDRKKPSRLVAVLVEEETGERTFMSASDSTRMTEDDVPSRLIENADYLLVDQYHPSAAIRSAELAKKSGTKIVADVEELTGESKRLIEAADLPIVPRSVAEAYGGPNLRKTALELLERGPETVIVTLGESGCLLVQKGKAKRKESYQVEVVDTTGAGDVFHGAYIAALLKDYGFEEAAEFASAASAINCRTLGGRSGIPTFDEVVEFLAERSSHWRSDGRIEK